MHWVEKLLFRIAEFCVAHAMQIRQRKQTFLALQRQKETTANRTESESRPVFLVRVIQNGKRKSVVT
jgi:hypothetical protein